MGTRVTSKIKSNEEMKILKENSTKGEDTEGPDL